MIRIEYQADKNRAIALDTDKEDKRVGKIKYVEQEGNWVVNSTFVRPDYTGQGIAGLLLEEIVKQAREKGVKIVPECSYVEHAFEKKEEYADVWAK